MELEESVIESTFAFSRFASLMLVLAIVFIVISLIPVFSHLAVKVVEAPLTLLNMCILDVTAPFSSIIWISLLKYVNNIGAKKEEKPAGGVENAISQIVTAEEESDETDDLELVAVITAAIAASEGTSSDGLVVRSIKRRF